MDPKLHKFLMANHFSKHQDYSGSHPSLNKIMSNLQHVHEGLKTPMSSQPNLQALRRENEFQDKNVSSAALLSQESLHQPPLRKSSSAIDWNGAVVEATRKTSRQFDWQAALFDNSRKQSFSNLHPFAQAASQHQGGLVMTTLDNKQQQGMSVATQQMPQQQNNFAQTLAQSASTASAPAATTAPATAPAPAPGSRGAHLFGGVFHRGFFSKPVERTEEENYRYLMALDR
ncbi:hypothetical protein L5515_017618 [Caenorhabditis briggsae]|uniref:Uncharacterized protein n=1 Tax=Caenorhabditis briggsae TaxID=6238 RepID=A0AAE9FEZ0_CAEBR|nr:hypothetical protein L5515_017618 [Caenorhabditis briggsae]